MKAIECMALNLSATRHDDGNGAHFGTTSSGAAKIGIASATVIAADASTDQWLSESSPP